MIDESAALALVRERFPELAAQRAVLLGGRAIRSFLVDDAHVFRFPIGAGSAARLELEMRLLEVLAARVPCAVPDHRLRSTGIVGHPVLEGPIARTAHPDPRVLGDALGHALAALAAFPIGEVLALGMRWRPVPSHNLATLFRELVSRYERTRGALDRELVARCDRLVTGSAIPPPYVASAVLVHGGISQLTVHVGPRLGLAAWDEVHLGDPAVDLGSICFAFGRDALVAAALAMGRQDAIERAIFVSCCSALAIVSDPQTPAIAKVWALDRAAIA